MIVLIKVVNRQKLCRFTINIEIGLQKILRCNKRFDKFPNDKIRNIKLSIQSYNAVEYGERTTLNN